MNINLLLYFSIGCFVLSFIAYLMDDVVTYKLNTSYVRFCREVIKWTGPILVAEGIKYYPTITLRYNKSSKKMGIYVPSTNSIVIYLKSHEGNVAEICSTVLHEIKHHIQSKNDPSFRKLINYKKYGYYNNRIELEARNFELTHCKQCLSDLCKKGFLTKL
jgi:hypothetical protein